MAATIRVSVPKVFLGKVADKADRDGGDKYGKATGLRVVHYAGALLHSNMSQHATDETLAATFKAEFPKRKVIQAIPAWRGYFNQGLHGVNPDKALGHSQSYNEDGEARRKAEPKAKGGKAKGGKAKGKGKASK